MNLSQHNVSPNILKERKATNRDNNINVSFSMQEAKYVVDILNKKEKEIERATQLTRHNTSISNISNYLIYLIPIGEEFIEVFEVLRFKYNSQIARIEDG